MQVGVRLAPLGEVEESLPELLGRVDAAGFDGVVLAGLDEPRLAPLAEAVGETGLEPVAAHVPYDRLQADSDAVVRELRTVGCERVVVPGLHEAHFEAAGEVARMAVRLSALGGRLSADGRTLCYHTPGPEFRALGDRTGFDVLRERSGDGLRFEFDAGVAAAADRDAAAELAALSGRVPLVDVTPVDEAGGRLAPDEWDLDLAGLAGAADEAGAEWLVHAVDDPTHPDVALRRAAERLRSVAD